MKFITLLLTTLIFSFNVQASNPKVKIETNMGDMVLELYPKKSPKTVKNFLSYVNDGFYNGTIFHRIINNFMIQGGGFELNKENNREKKSTKPPIKNEAKISKLLNTKGTIAMARTNDPHSATSQFFINHKDNSFLDPSVKNDGYAVFGKLIKGDKTLNKIATTTTKPDDSPIKNIIIKKVSTIDDKKKVKKKNTPIYN